MLCAQGIPRLWECDAVHIWVKAGAEKPSSEVATPSLLDRAGLGSSLALKQSWFGTTNNGPKAQTELTRMAFLERHNATLKPIFSRGGLVFIQLLLGCFLSKPKAW